ncbi:hypothetical protein BBK14_24395 [Parafrankia soli]|uniref:Uncharacterized protein n=1 Tax=Parafrankia soli TaxID=2599596 RepID=A0A1S1PQT0_9ACTN|nr:hypothetical protein [Parafrankia soli]OHV23265.1 hypothetical protein BBK14_24395 [Parafrankia soli]
MILDLLAVAVVLAGAFVLRLGLHRRPGRGGEPGWVGNDLSAWHAAHRDPFGEVWAVTPPCGSGQWSLFAPGSPTGGAWPYLDVAPAATHPTAGYGGDSDRTELADVESWMRSWVEQASGGRVTAMVEGWSEPYGPDGDLAEYVIYARVAR